MSARRSVMPKRPIRAVAFVSDIHCGSTVAIMPPQLKLAEDNIVKQNTLQAWFWQCWLDQLLWIKETMGDDPFALVLNGDLIEGDHHRTDQIIGRNIGDHIDCAEAVLKPLVALAAKLFVVRGTECHVGDAEAALAKRFGAEKNPETQRPVFDRLTLEVCGVRLVAKHHVSTTSRGWLESNGLGLELASEQLNAVRNGEEMPRIVAVGHRHNGGDVSPSEGICLATPAWQGLTRHGHKVVGAARCRPGMYILDWRGVNDGELPIIRKRLYAAPQPKAIEL